MTYVPDAAPVRQKMLFASTRLTLVRELGGEHFRETIFATTAEELSGRGFEKHDKHSKLEAPLTEEERSLGEVKRAEMEAGSGTGTREIHLSKSLAMPVGESALEALKQLGEDGGRVLVMLVSLSWFISPASGRGANACAENQSRDRGCRTRPRQLYSDINSRIGTDHLVDGAEVHLLPIHTLVRRESQLAAAVLLHLPDDAGQ